MAESLGQKQRRFVRLVGILIEYAYTNGFELTFGEALRTKTQAEANAQSGAGIGNSLHLIKLAIDFNLFIDGDYQMTSEAHRQIGEYWKTLGSDCRWGGDFKPRPDGNHYSIEHNGVK